jgi:uncharacterized protein involved in exopolysaccharide biosynthesis
MATITAASVDQEQTAARPASRWLLHSGILWRQRRVLARVTVISLLVSLGIAFVIPKRYKSSASIMPPDQQSPGAAMLAALAGRLGSIPALGLANALPGAHSSSELFVDLLRSGTVSDHLLDRFNLQHLYRKRYRIDAAKRLARLTTISENRKSGVITIEVEDTDPRRAQAMTQAYLDELNRLVVRTNTSAAHRERVFIGQRLQRVRAGLEQAEIQLSRFSSDSTAIDIREQMRAMLDASARVEAELMVEQSGLQALRQLYGDDNLRVRESEARIASLQAQLSKMEGSRSAPSADALTDAADTSEVRGQNAPLYPPLRELPRLAVPYTDLLRSVQVQESVFQLLTQQYETARIEEARDVPPVNVIDSPGLPEKKSFPPRLLLTAAGTLLGFASASFILLSRHYWQQLPPADPRREFVAEVAPVLRRRFRFIFRRAGGSP